MAIDTAEKRQGISGVGRTYLRSKFPQTTPDEEWRHTTGHSYGGNALSPTVGGNRIMSSLANAGGLASYGGIAGKGGGLAG